VSDRYRVHQRFVQLHHVSLGLVYLHSKKIVHGDLKAVGFSLRVYLQVLIYYSSQVNVLVDDNEKAVLCDFGLSQVKADATSRTAILNAALVPVAGSRNWMAPERLMGGLLRRPCDIYALGIMIPEVCTWMLC
jgi:serine/threonine protein kinase